MATLTGKESDLVHMLNKLIELDFDAIEAYRAAIDKIKDTTSKAKLQEFMGDHERHTRELSDVVRGMGSEPADKADYKKLLTKGKVVIAGLTGDRGVLIAMKSNEDDTNTAYERAVARPDVPSSVRELLQRNLDDEKRHREWIVRRLEERFGQEARASR